MTDECKPTNIYVYKYIYVKFSFRKLMMLFSIKFNQEKEYLIENKTARKIPEQLF